jgi:hypothetical protein
MPDNNCYKAQNEYHQKLNPLKAKLNKLSENTIKDAHLHYALTPKLI